VGRQGQVSRCVCEREGVWGRGEGKGTDRPSTVAIEAVMRSAGDRGSQHCFFCDGASRRYCVGILSCREPAFAFMVAPLDELCAVALLFAACQLRHYYAHGGENSERCVEVA